MIEARQESLSALERRAAGLAALVDVSGALAATLELDRILQHTTDGVCRLAGFDTAAVYLLDGATLRLEATTPPLPPGFPDQLRVAPLADHPHVGRSLQARAPLLVPDVEAEAWTEAERAVADQRHLRTILYCPMLAGDKAVGVLIVSEPIEPRALGPDEVDLCRTLANLAALATENARLFQASRAQALALERSAEEARRADAERLELERRLLHAQKLESLGILAGGVAHDFNNLLQAMQGNLDLAMGDLTPDAPAREPLRQAVRAARRATDLTRQLLAYSGKGRFVVRPLELGALVRENAHMLRASVPHTCAIAVHLAEGLPPIEADVGQLQQVVMNLITNAADAIGARPGTITITTGRRAGGPGALEGNRVADARPAEAYVALEVADDGCGMDQATLARIFDPFFSTKAVGRGLGMPALLGIVRGHGGALFVDSTPGRGTRVKVLFPVRPGATAPAEAAPHLTPAPLRPPPAAGTVLVVDDEELVRRAAESMVRRLGMPVLAASGGQEAVALIRARPGEVRLVLLDLSMPGMDGLATLDALLAIAPGLRVILSSGFDEQSSLGRERGGRFAGFLQKPYSVAELREALARAAAP
ncbi:MAG: response regulator [Anaeromyxobacter sp.]